MADSFSHCTENSKNCSSRVYTVLRDSSRVAVLSATNCEDAIAKGSVIVRQLLLPFQSINARTPAFPENLDRYNCREATEEERKSFEMLDLRWQGAKLAAVLFELSDGSDKPDEITEVLMSRSAADTSSARSSPTGGITEAEAAVSFRAVIKLFSLWSISDDQAALLLAVPDVSIRLHRDGSSTTLYADTRLRLSYLLGIHKSLRLLFGNSERVYEWCKAPNSAFGGKSALHVMCDDGLDGIKRVRAYLEASVNDS